MHLSLKLGEFGYALSPLFLTRKKKSLTLFLKKRKRKREREREREREKPLSKNKRSLCISFQTRGFQQCLIQVSANPIRIGQISSNYLLQDFIS